MTKKSYPASFSLLEYKNALSHKKFDFKNSPIIRLSNKKDLPDQYVTDFEGIVDPFIIDQVKIADSKAYRRLGSKTQVVFYPENPHIRVRSTHTVEVGNPAMMASDILGLNTHLVKAICDGHDMGHAPAGHMFETVSKEFGTEFRHEIFSAIIAIFIEKQGGGLNLTKQTIEGILNHSRGAGELTTGSQIDEYNLAMYSDKIAYIFSDINDLQRINKLSTEDLVKIDSIFPCDPKVYNDQQSKINLCINALVKESAEKGFVCFKDSEVAKNFIALKKYMYMHYAKLDSNLLREIIRSVIKEVSTIKGYDPILLTALMTDRELKILYEKIISSKTINIDDIIGFGVGEIIKTGALENQTYKNLNLKLKQKLAV
ncbi:MAG: HD domain-containing protein [Candidatus Shapirobacteria bacterium]